MPQMSPLSWELLFIFFIMMYMLVNIIMYYNKTIHSPSHNKINNLSNNQLNWKW